MFQALDQFEVEKLGREVRRGQAENTRQGYRNGGRAPYGYRLRHEPHPDPRRAHVGDTKSRLVPDADQAPVAVEIFERYLGGWGFNEIANHLNRPGGPAPPVHVDSTRNTARKWSKTTIRAILDNPVYTGRLYWNRLDFRAVKQGDGPLVRREREHWIQAEQRHEALIPDDWFERVGAEMHRRRTGQASPRRRTPNRFYVLGGIVHCATGHNPLRMQGKTRKGNTYYACGYRISYGDKAAHALGHGKWHYVREDRITDLVDHFFATRIFGPARIARFKAQHADLTRDLQDRDDGQRHLTSQLTDIDQRLQRQLAAIEAGVDAVLVGDRVRALKAERQQVDLAIAHIDDDRGARTGLDLDDACAILDGLPNLRDVLAAADPKLRRQVYDAFRLSVEIDRNEAQIRLKALVSSAFTGAPDREGLVAHKATTRGAPAAPSRWIGEQLDVGAHRGEYVEQTGPGGIHTDIADEHLGIGVNRCRDEPVDRNADLPWNPHVEWSQRRAHRLHADGRRLAVDHRAHRAKHVLGVVARWLGASEQRLAFGLQRREQDGSLGLATRNLKVMANPAQDTAAE